MSRAGWSAPNVIVAVAANSRDANPDGGTLSIQRLGMGKGLLRIVISAEGMCQLQTDTLAHALEPFTRRWLVAQARSAPSGQPR